MTKMHQWEIKLPLKVKKVINKCTGIIFRTFLFVISGIKCIWRNSNVRDLRIVLDTKLNSILLKQGDGGKGSWKSLMRKQFVVTCLIY